MNTKVVLMAVGGVLGFIVVALSLAIALSITGRNDLVSESTLIVSESALADKFIGQRQSELAGPVLGVKTVVKIQYSLLGVTEVNENLGYMESTGWVWMTWPDTRLPFPQEIREYNVENVRMTPDRIWIPDVVLYNPASSGVRHLNEKSQLVRVNENGTVTYAMLVSIRSLCDVSGQLATGSSVECFLRFGSWVYDESTVDVEPMFFSGPAERDDLLDLDLDVFQATGQWTVTSATQQRQSLTYNCCPNPYSKMTFSFQLQRR